MGNCKHDATESGYAAEPVSISLWEGECQSVEVRWNRSSNMCFPLCRRLGLNPQNEARIIELLASLKGQRSIVLGSHRLSTVADCDRIVVLGDGTVVECGSHAELVNKRGVYYEMARLQLKLDTPARPAAA